MNSGPLAAAARALTQAVAGVDTAWLAAAAGLGPQRTGEALHACLPAMRRELRACAEEVAGIGAALSEAAAVYEGSETAAIGSGS